MNNDDKKKYLEILYQNKHYLEALELVDSKSDKRKIKSFAEDLFLSFAEGFVKAAQLVKENPEKVVEIESKHIPKK